MGIAVGIAVGIAAGVAVASYVGAGGMCARVANALGQVKVIQLDLRTARDKYYIFDMSGKQFPFASKLGALLR